MKFKSTHSGPIVVAIPGIKTVSLKPGEEYETDDKVEIAALKANTDLEVAKGKSK